MSADPALEVFQDLSVHGTAQQLTDFRRLLLETLKPPWSHDAEAEERSRQYSGFSESLALVRDETLGLPSAGLWMFRDAESYTVGNIVPKTVSELGRARYNAILNDFIEAFARTAASASGAILKATQAQQSLDDWIPADAVERLQLFSSLANKSTGSGHPLDRRRWFDFLLSVHGYDDKLGTDRLMRWLVKVEQWPEDRAHDLVIEYEFAMGLLNRLNRGDA